MTAAAEPSDSRLFPKGSSVTGRVAGSLVFLAFTILLPLKANGYQRGILAQALVLAIAVMGFDILVGWSGQIGLAHAGFFAVGAYGTSMMFERNMPFLVAILLFGAFSAAIGVLIGFPAARLTGFFLAIVTLAFGELIVKIIERGKDFASWTSWLDTGGGTGMLVKTWNLTGDKTNELTAYYLSLAFFVLFWVAFWHLTRGRLGRTLKAIRDIEVVTGSLGIPATRYKLVAFGISAFAAAVAGGLWAQVTPFINPSSFRLNLLVTFLTVLIVGGIGRMWGPLIGALFYLVVREWLQDLEQYQRLVFGIGLMISILILPGGLASIPDRIRGRRRREGGRAPAVPALARLWGRSAGEAGGNGGEAP